MTVQQNVSIGATDSHVTVENKTIFIAWSVSHWPQGKDSVENLDQSELLLESRRFTEIYEGSEQYNSFYMYDPVEEDPPPTPNRRKNGSCAESFLGNEEERQWNAGKSTSAEKTACSDHEEAEVFSERASVEAVMGLMITDLESSTSSEEQPQIHRRAMDYPPFNVPSFAASAMTRPSYRHGSLSLACAR